MQRPITLQKNYAQNQEGYQLKIPFNIETIIPENDSVRLLSQFVEAMDMTDLIAECEEIYGMKIVYGDTVKMKYVRSCEKSCMH